MKKQSVWIPSYAEGDFSDIDELFESWLPAYQKLFLFGAGAYAKAWRHYLSQCGVRIDGFVVSEPQCARAETNEPIISLGDFKSLYKRGETGLILTIDSDYYGEILPNLLFAFDDLFFLKEKYKALALARSVNDTRKSNLNIAYLVTDHCNLSCFGCDAGSPIAKKRFANTEQVINDFSRFRELMGDDTIGNISFSGGEPLLHPQFVKMLAAARESFPSCPEINFYTNGLLLAEQTVDFWESLAVFDITIMWTKYPIHYKNEKTIYEYAKKYNVKLQLAPDMLYSPKESWWVGFDITGRQKKWDYLFCFYHSFRIQLNDGKLYSCPMITSGELIGSHFEVPLPVDENLFIDIYKAKSPDEIFDFLSKRAHFCDYCAIRQRRSMGHWRPSKRERSEWLLEEIGE